VGINHVWMNQVGAVREPPVREPWYANRPYGNGGMRPARTGTVVCEPPVREPWYVTRPYGNRGMRTARTRTVVCEPPVREPPLHDPPLRGRINRIVIQLGLQYISDFVQQPQRVAAGWRWSESAIIPFCCDT
jgi:hypothetical protein